MTNMQGIRLKKRIKWPRTRIERYRQYGDMGSTERLRFSQSVSRAWGSHLHKVACPVRVVTNGGSKRGRRELGESRARLASITSAQSEQDDLSLAASAHGFYAKATKAPSPKKWQASFGQEPPLAHNEDSWAEWGTGTLNSVNMNQHNEIPNNYAPVGQQFHPKDRLIDSTDHFRPPPSATSKVAFVFDDDPADGENYYVRQARINKKHGGMMPFLDDSMMREPEPEITTVPSPLDHPGAPRVKSLIYTGQEIASFSDLVWPFIGMVGYCMDVGSDIALALEYAIAELYAWLALTVIFIALPAIAMTILSLVMWWRNYKILKEKVSPVQWTMRIVSSVFLSTPIMRMVDIFYFGWQSRNTTHDWYTRRMLYERMIDEETECAMVRLFETFLENAPQLVLQLYVISVVGTTKGLVLVFFQVAGMVISWIQMSMSLVSFHTVLRASLQPEKAKMTWGGRICMFLWRLFTIASRVVAIALFASHFQFYVLAFVGGHFLIMFIWIMNQDSTYCQVRQKERNGTVIVHDAQVSELLFRLMAAFVHSFCFINLLEGPTRLRYAFYYVIMFLENLTMIIMWYTFGGTVTDTTWYHGPALAAVIGGFIIGIIFQVLYYMFFHPNNNNPAYRDRRIKCCRPCKEISLIHNKPEHGYDDDDDDDDVIIVKSGTHIEPFSTSRPTTEASMREDYTNSSWWNEREGQSYAPMNNSFSTSGRIPLSPEYYPEPRGRSVSTSSMGFVIPRGRSVSQSSVPPQHHPLNHHPSYARADYVPDDTPLPPLLHQRVQARAHPRGRSFLAVSKRKSSQIEGDVPEEQESQVCNDENPPAETADDPALNVTTVENTTDSSNNNRNSVENHTTFVENTLTENIATDSLLRNSESPITNTLISTRNSNNPVREDLSLRKIDSPIRNIENPPRNTSSPASNTNSPVRNNSSPVNCMATSQQNSHSSSTVSQKQDTQNSLEKTSSPVSQRKSGSLTKNTPVRNTSLMTKNTTSPSRHNASRNVPASTGSKANPAQKIYTPGRNVPSNISKNAPTPSRNIPLNAKSHPVPSRSYHKPAIKDTTPKSSPSHSKDIPTHSALARNIPKPDRDTDTPSQILPIPEWDNPSHTKNMPTRGRNVPTPARYNNTRAVHSNPVTATPSKSTTV